MCKRLQENSKGGQSGAGDNGDALPLGLPGPDFLK